MSFESDEILKILRGLRSQIFELHNRVKKNEVELKRTKFDLEGLINILTSSKTFKYIKERLNVNDLNDMS